jgi:hypothetical protein
MALWRTGSDGKPERFIPSEYVFGDMDSELAHQVLGRLLDLLWETGKISDSQMVEILGLRGLSTVPSPPLREE